MSIEEQIVELIRTKDESTIQLYSDLCNLIATNDSFYVSEYAAGTSGNVYRVFSYRLSSYSDFLLPGALEARGIMFEVDEHGTLLRIASRPMEKFWNVGENPLTLDLDFDRVSQTYVKEDGSLISTFTERVAGMGEDFQMSSELMLRVKSKTSIASDQAQAALKYIHSNPKLQTAMLQLEAQGYTVNCEWTSPDNRIVVGYLEPKLIVLNARHRLTGEYLARDVLVETFPHHVVAVGEQIKSAQDVERLRTHTGYEGVILEFDDGYRVRFAKLKNDWYLHRHKTKDSVNNVNHLFDAVLHEAVDDLKTLFLEDELAMRRINEMETLVVPLYNSYVKCVEEFYQANKHLDRKDFAVKAQQEFPQAHSPLNKISFSAMMSLYQGKAPSYKELLSKHKKSFIKMDDTQPEE